ncbi:adenylosuccinate lyase [Planctomycetaceae bacterium SCGC AG-212-D15]|nr:adenylosuccinate lyase [Planctomycetaceae bacterium SCGC AG-212-D15]
MSDYDVYDNPLVTRYASREMAELWGPQRKFSTWRRLWVALAEAERDLGMLGDDGQPRISEGQIAALRAHVNDIDFARAAELERRKRHDVMAHVATLAEACPAAADIIHLGATSCYVTDNTDLLLMREGLGMLRDALVGVIDALARFAQEWRDLPTLGFTHFQPAQLTTVGKRATLWAYDFVLDLEEVERRLESIRFRGVKGTTGTQASFLALFRGDHARVRELDRLVARKMGFEEVYPVTGQTYSRKVDAQVLASLAGVGQSAHKFGTDLRLLAHRQEVEEPFEAEQVGSSAMAYKRNPMRAERMCGLARFAEALVVSADQTASVQWLERTLDDSVNRRLTLPQAFLTIDAVLRLALNIGNGLAVNPDVIVRNVEQMLPYMATENILMAAVARGGDRQMLHERIRQHSMEVTAALKEGAAKNDLLARLRGDPAFGLVDFDAVLERGLFMGRAPEQVDEFIAEVIAPIRSKYPHLGSQNAELSV